MVTCNSIGYFTLVLSAPLPLVLPGVTPSPHLNSLGFISAMPSLPPATLLEHMPVCFSSGPPPSYIIPPLMLQPTQGQRPPSWFRGLYFHSIITWPFFFQQWPQ
jgi:hypothetical protein